jgi:hypothetical protein
MSLANISAGRDFALAAVDTEVVSAGGLHSSATKILCFPHASAALLARGNIAFSATCFSAGAVVYSGDPDLWIKPMCDFYSELYAVLAKRGGILLPSTDPEQTGEQLVLVAYDRAQCQFRLWHFSNPGGAPFSAAEIDGRFIAPGESDRDPGPIDTIDDMIRVSRSQVGLMRSRFGPTAACGGDLIIAHLTPDQITLKRFENFAPLGRVQ